MKNLVILFGVILTMGNINIASADVQIDNTDPATPVYTIDEVDLVGILRNQDKAGELLDATINLVESQSYKAPLTKKSNVIKLQTPRKIQGQSVTLNFTYEHTLMFSQPAPDHTGVRHVSNGLDVVYITIKGNFRTDENGKFTQPKHLGFDTITTRYDFIAPRNDKGSMSSGG